MKKKNIKPYKNLGDLFDRYWGLLILRVDNGYILVGRPGESESNHPTVIEEDPQDELKDGESLLFEVMNYFNFGGTKHDKERLKIVREKQ